jgi:Fic family protein
MEQIFVSSVQKELQAERYAVRDFVHSNDLLRQFFKVFLFEDLPPSDRKPDDVYPEQVESSPIYIGIFGNEYGREDNDGLSPTEKEFAIASRQTASRDLEEMVRKGMLERQGERRGTFYVKAKKMPRKYLE